MIKPLFRSSCVIAILSAIPLSLLPGARADSPEAVQVYQQGLETHPSQGEVRPVAGTAALLMTSKSGAFASVVTQRLTPRNVHTLWWVVINEPAACETSPCKPPDVLERSQRTRADVVYADGVIAGDDGAAQFASYLPAGALTKGWFGSGFDNPKDAEIHLVINDHGPLVADIAASMLTSYRGGCTDESLPPAFPATAKSDGLPGPNACRLVQDVAFIQETAKSAKAQ